MGLFDSKLKSYSTLSPDQEKLMGALGPRLTAMAGQDPSAFRFGGQMTAPITEQETANVNRSAALADSANSRIGSLADYNDPAFNEQFQKEIADPTYRDFTTNIQPILEEALPSFSTARANVVARELGNVQEKVLQQRFAARESAKDRAINATKTMGDLYSQTQKTVAVPREIAQAGLDREFQNFYLGNEQYQKGIDSMLNYLGIQTKGYINEGSTYDKILAGVNTAANVLSAFTGGGTSSVNSGGSSSTNGVSGSWKNDYMKGISTDPKTGLMSWTG